MDKGKDKLFDVVLIVKYPWLVIQCWSLEEKGISSDY